LARAIAQFSDYQSLVDALRAAREKRNISFELMDKLGGVSDGYFSKVLAPRGSRKVTMQSLGWAMGALGVRTILVDDPVTLGMIQSRMKPRRIELVRNSRSRKNGG
jgi:hypothetical protein